jgi:uncharacterized membrane protein YvlD (DUF360 family)
MRRFLRVIYRFAIVWGIQGLCLLAIHWLVPGITLATTDSADLLSVAMSVALVLALLNVLIRPLLVWLTLPLNIITLGLFTLIINAGVLLLASYLLPYFNVAGLGSALLGILVLTVVNTIVTRLTTIDDDYSFFDGVVQWLSKRQRVSLTTESGRGLVMLEIDGLSYPRIQRAVEEGLMPTVRKMLLEGTHELSSYDCGLPSQTSSCQAGIMYGENFDIPAFRWYDKDRGKMMVSSNFRDAAEMNARYAHGQGLLRGGSSINNHMAGDAQKTLFTMSVLTNTPENMQQRSFGDLNLTFINPYMFSRNILLTLWDVLVELGQGLRQLVLNVRPRVNRLHKGYPLVRAATNVLLRDLATFMVIMDVIRGVPAIYTTYVGYDEVAHHAGPDRSDAMKTLKGLDKQLGRILSVINRKAKRPYDVILLSDHGQSMGATFEQRYGQTLTEFIRELLQKKATVTEIDATENGYGNVTKLLAEIQGMEENVPVGRIRGTMLGRASKAFQSRLERDVPPAVMDAQVIVCDSGNLANVYFDLHAGKVNMNELDLAYPGLLDALVAHPGVGFVVAYAGDGAPWVLGKNGARNLLTNTVTASDPLVPYGAPDHRAAQLLYLAQFPHAGDLIVNSTLYADGQVAAFEELVGSHGGLGGQQTEAFLLHPADMTVPATSNATEVFALLDARRGLPGEPLRPRVTPTVNAWAARNLLAGVRDVRTWVPRAARALRINRAVFREVANDPFATGPALVIMLTVLAIFGLVDGLDPDIPGTMLNKFAGGLISGFAAWIAMVLLAHAAGRLLRGKGDLTRTMRTVTFSQVPLIITLLAVLPVVGPFLSLAAFVVALFALWVALQEAMGLRKLLAALVPIVGLLVFIGVVVLVSVMLNGMALTIQTLLLALGIL